MCVIVHMCVSHIAFIGSLTYDVCQWLDTPNNPRTMCVIVHMCVSHVAFIGSLTYVNGLIHPTTPGQCVSLSICVSAM